MNIRLSCVSDRVHGKNCYVVEKDGKEIESHVYSITGTNIKKNALDALYRGLRVVKNIAKHEDLVVIELQNCHLAEWVSGRKESKGYEEELDKVFEVLESIDSRYIVRFVKNTYAKKVAEARGISTPKVTGVDFMKEL